MRQGFNATNDCDEKGMPAGGTVEGNGILIRWQEGPLGRGEDRIEPNGAFVEDVLEAARQRIAYYQNVGGRQFSCRENALAITKIEEALLWLDKRTRDREARQVEGTHEA